LEGDRVLAPDIETLREMVHSGEFASIAAEVTEQAIAVS